MARKNALVLCQNLEANLLAEVELGGEQGGWTQMIYASHSHMLHLVRGGHIRFHVRHISLLRGFGPIVKDAAAADGAAHKFNILTNPLRENGRPLLICLRISLISKYCSYHGTARQRSQHTTLRDDLLCTYDGRKGPRAIASRKIK